MSSFAAVRMSITLIGGAVASWPLPARAQQPWGRPLIALLSPVSAATATRNIAGFRNGLRDLGLIEGRNIFLALRFAGGVAERMPVFARELVDLKPDVLIAAPESSLAAVRALTTTVPILTIWLRDPVLTGTVESIAHPAQNVTGTWIAGDDALVGKRLELLKEAVPGVMRVALFVNAADLTDKAMIDLATNAARALGLTLTVIPLRDAAGIEAAFATAARRDGARRRCSSVRARFFNTHRAELAERAQRARLPAIYGFREFAFCRWHDVLRSELAGGLSTVCHSRREDHPKRREAGQSADRGADPLRAGYQPQGRQRDQSRYP